MTSVVLDSKSIHNYDRSLYPWDKRIIFCGFLLRFTDWKDRENGSGKKFTSQAGFHKASSYLPFFTSIFLHNLPLLVSVHFSTKVRSFLHWLSATVYINGETEVVRTYMFPRGSEVYWCYAATAMFIDKHIYRFKGIAPDSERGGWEPMYKK